MFLPQELIAVLINYTILSKNWLHLINNSKYPIALDHSTYRVEKRLGIYANKQLVYIIKIFSPIITFDNRHILLTYACIYNKIGLCKSVISKDFLNCIYANYSARKTPNDPLSITISHNHVELTRYLLQLQYRILNGALVDTESSSRFGRVKDLLFRAVDKDNVDMIILVMYYLSCYVSFEKVIPYACKVYHLDCIKRLLKLWNKRAGGRIQMDVLIIFKIIKRDIDDYDNHSNHLKMIKLLIKYDKRICTYNYDFHYRYNAKTLINEFGTSEPIVYALRHGKLDIARLLINRVCDEEYNKIRDGPHNEVKNNNEKNKVDWRY